MANQQDLTQYKLDWRPRPADPREWRYALAIMAVDRTKQRSLAKYFGPVDDQGAEGSCVANSAALVMEACAAIGGVALPVPELSREEIYYLGRLTENTFPQDVGMYTADGFDVVLKQGGAHLETDWPYDANPSERPPAALATKPKALYISGHSPIPAGQYIDGILGALDATRPLVLALNWYQEFFQNYQSSGVLSAGPTSAIVGGHQIAVKGWTPAQGGLVFCQNSWGLTSPARTDLHPDAKPGDVFLPVALFAGVVMEVRAALPAVAPAPPAPTPPPPSALTVSISGPATLAPAQTGSFSLVSTGSAKPQYRVDWGDGSMDAWSPNNAPAHGYAQPGGYTLTALVFDPAAGRISAPAKLTVTVAAAPTPPTPGNVTIASATITYGPNGLRSVYTMSDGTTRLVP